MITNVSLATVWVTDQDEAKAFYVDKLGFREATDITMGDGYRWLTVCHPDHPELEVTLMKPGPAVDDEDAAIFRRMLDKGRAREPPAIRSSERGHPTFTAASPRRHPLALGCRRSARCRCSPPPAPARACTVATQRRL
jgi:catechol 2,3-dioxygenase-like lactoylglutathione lyase family enzyme